MKPSTRLVFDEFAASGFGWVHGNDLLRAAGTRYSARLYDLKHDHGWDHEKRPDPRSSVPWYRIFRSEPEQLSIAL
jgi:hypothetical protein